MAKRHMIPMFIPHAGCPNACVFCDQRQISGAAAPVTPEEVRRTLERQLPLAGRGCELCYYGGSFTAMAPELQEGLLEAAQPYLRSGDLGAIRVSTRPDAVDGETIARLRAYGVTTVELGAQSMDDRVLAESRRGHRAEDTRRAAALLRAGDFSLILQMMTGLPGDDGSASRETARALAALEPQGVRIYPTVVLGQTELQRRMEAGTYRPQTLEEAVSLCAELYEIFLAAEIPVIRLGLNPTEALSAGGALAGPYHPALGELVLSRMYLRRAEALLEVAGPMDSCALVVHPRRVSAMVGQKRCNLQALREKFSLKQIKVSPEGRELWETTLQKL